jgi:hypothetical protein
MRLVEGVRQRCRRPAGRWLFDAGFCGRRRAGLERIPADLAASCRGDEQMITERPGFYIVTHIERDQNGFIGDIIRAPNQR